MNILITGITGFVGNNLQKYLFKKQNIVTSLDLRSNEWKKKLDNMADAIIHLAGKAHDTKKTSGAAEYFEINTDLTATLFDAFLASGIKDFIYFSSVKAVADEVATILDETEIPNPKTPYGQSKLQAEKYILSKEIPQGKRVFIIRPCMIHGPGNKGNLNLLYNIVNKRIPYPLAAFENQRSFLSIDNLNYLIENILSNNNVPSGIYNFADDTGISTNDLVKIIGSVSDQNVKLINIPKLIIYTIAKAGDVLKLPLNSETLKKLTENYKVSNKKIKTALSIASLPVSTQVGLEKTIKSFII
ncbi:NAD-dependent epimerase/dehydratase family protein [Flavobacterium kingsejongi]|uniref:Nucleoside-diphosphate-sugar epimerase n=1 Tax=Flavobacterium kingsejongi TaxID=1678728 RepID=A0A2S1LNP4_9FLAO|nr:NAD-dependent epimerase/dehydratase family protein [Flavobacterium kingsejongi]AWG25373.1 nucleoside-diphosphate-sugar epimerase [Flavobacterium kingsejongi]